jgi:hypothetical protein
VSTDKTSDTSLDEREKASKKAVKQALALAAKVVEEAKEPGQIEAAVGRDYGHKQTLSDLMREMFLQGLVELDLPMEDLLKYLAFQLSTYHHSEFSPEIQKSLRDLSGVFR